MTSRTVSLENARRLSIVKQCLAGPRPKGIMDVFRALGCIQIDPVSVVAPSHQLVLWSRMGPFEVSEVDRLLFWDRNLFEYWAHAASMVPTEDLPIFKGLMESWGTGNSSWERRLRGWMTVDDELLDDLYRQVDEKGPTTVGNLELPAEKRVEGVPDGRIISPNLNVLLAQGRIFVSGRRGRNKLWDTAERFIPELPFIKSLEWTELTRVSAQKSLRALGVATERHIASHYIRDSYPCLKETLGELVSDEVIHRVTVDGLTGEWYIHREDLPLLEKLETGWWSPRTCLLSPFDNLIADRERARQLYDFDYAYEFYKPKAKRVYGTYVMPLLHGDTLAGRIDLKMDRKHKTLQVNRIFWEPKSNPDKVNPCLRKTIEDLTGFLGAEKILYPK